MKRRDFIELTASMTAMIWVGSLFDHANSQADPSTTRSGGSVNRLRMAGGGCHDFRLMRSEPTAAFEREILGIWA